MTTDTVLVVGASGVFGARLVTGLVQTTPLHMWLPPGGMRPGLRRWRPATHPAASPPW